MSVDAQRIADVESLLDRAEALEDGEPRQIALGLAQALLDLHGEGLSRIVEVLASRDDGEKIAGALAGDELVSHLLLLHGLHPVPVRDRVEEALASVLPYLKSHGGAAELIDVRDGVARLRLKGSCSGCPSSTITLKHAIEEAIFRAAPDVEEVEAEGAMPPAPLRPGDGLIQLEIACPAPQRAAPPPSASQQAAAERLAPQQHPAPQHPASQRFAPQQHPAPQHPAPQRFAPQADEEHCELCGAQIGERHRHLLELSEHRLVCVCRPCSLLFDREGAGDGRYRLIPDRRLRLEDFELGDAAWEELAIPVQMAFFFHSTSTGRVVAFYPGPMGPTESALQLRSWDRLADANPILAEMEPDVEALLVDRSRSAPRHWLVPLEDCYALVGVMRTHWRGIAGGGEVWAQIDSFFEELDRRARSAAGRT